jgi:hypothetical protein
MGWEDDEMKTGYGKIKRGVLAVLCILAVLSAAVPRAVISAEAASVSSGEKKKIRRLLDGSILNYIEGYCNIPLSKQGDFKFHAGMKTDIAFHNVAYKDNVFSQYSSDRALMEKYRPYGGVFRYTDSVKEAVKKKGKQLFGNSFKLTFADSSGGSDFCNYPLSPDGKYVLMNFSDWGDWYVSRNYTGFAKKGSVYTARIKITAYWGGAEDDVTVRLFHADLKKKGSSFVITDIVLDK